MAIKQIISTIIALLQFFLGTLGIGIEYDTVDYGGNAYVEPIITQWLTLIENDESDYVIIKGENANESEVTAANVLQRYLRDISGVTLIIKDDSATTINTEIIVGKTNRENVPSISVDRNKLGNDGFIKKVVGQKLIIAGGELRGTLYGVYSFLEEQLGCRWYTSDLKKVPELSQVKIDQNLSDEQIPIFEYRDCYWQSTFNEDWMVKQKLNSQVRVNLSSENGGGIRYADFAHSLERLVPASYYEEHPDYFAFREDTGKWETKQRCLTNPEVVEIAIQNVRQALLKKPDADIISITQLDNQNYCQCENCKASDEYYDSPAGTMVNFVNQIAEVLGGEFPNVQFDTFAYQYTRKTPVNIIPRDNVIVRLCSIECCFCHPLDECGHESLVEYVSEKEPTFTEDLKAWSQICDNLYIWDYTTNFNLYLMPFPNFHVLSDNMQTFAENNVKGVFEQGNYTGGKSGEFGELRAYILSKLLWDPYCDVEYHMMDFMSAYYGADSALYIKEYIDMLTTKVSQTSHLFIFDWHYESGIFLGSEIKKIDRLCDNAQASAENSTQLNNIKRSRLSFRFYKGNLMLAEFSPLNPIKHYKENKKLYNDIKELGVTRLTEHKEIADVPNFWLNPLEWR
ncbi:MAG TPA: DUF4838 domain-containing protein [Clostridia bacterium]|nr:DUF4838 domain-containing protein [Clostridia bacterium]